MTAVEETEATSGSGGIHHIALSSLTYSSLETYLWEHTTSHMTWPRQIKTQRFRSWRHDPGRRQYLHEVRCGKCDMASGECATSSFLLLVAMHLLLY